MGGSTFLRRARCLIARWEDGAFVVENYVSARQTALAPIIVQLLGDADSYAPREEITERLSSVPRMDDVVDELIAQDLLLVKGSAIDVRDREIAETWEWGDDARYLHYTTQLTVYEESLDRESDELARRARDQPPPSTFKDCDGFSIELPEAFAGHTGDFWDVLRTRRTRRLFSGEPITLADFNSVLSWTWGATTILDDAELGEYVLKTSPSGGSRHPVEVYPVVLRVEGIASGVYHYSVRRHMLEEIRSSISGDTVVKLCADQHWVASAGAVFFMTAVLPRTMWKYHQSHAYRVLHLDAGHLGQTFHLVCTRLGLSPFTTAAINAPAVESELGVDGVREVALYAAAVGGR
jgi:SagB-type dehydrogenase family enzyme